MMKTSNTINRTVYFDVLNIIAILAVIALHCNGIVHGNPNIRAWNSSLLIECICYFAVPIFCMLSGATLMNYRKKYDTRTFLKKRVNKVLIPFIFWIIVMIIWKVATNQIDSNHFTTFSSFLNAIFSSEEETTYYFIL